MKTEKVKKSIESNGKFKSVFKILIEQIAFNHNNGQKVDLLSVQNSPF